MNDSHAYWKEQLLTVVFTPLENGYAAVIEELPELIASGNSFTEAKERLGILLNKKMPGRAPYGIKPTDGFKYVIKTMVY